MYIMHSWASMSENTRQQALKTRENMHHKQCRTKPTTESSPELLGLSNASS